MDLNERERLYVKKGNVYDLHAFANAKMKQALQNEIMAQCINRQSCKLRCVFPANDISHYLAYEFSKRLVLNVLFAYQNY